MSLEKIVKKHGFMDNYATTWYGKVIVFPIYVADNTIRSLFDGLIDLAFKYNLLKRYKKR